ncbi:MAG: PLP-dependent aminotransferase family protein [Actinomycetota bacterium]|nr:PLP-dependent aminotransferase family protein [Actinomycetota bacterium]MDQ2956921.1 PLP-dependent aminotransferase family protein [Actinomycetota bacterium]
MATPRPSTSQLTTGRPTHRLGVRALTALLPDLADLATPRYRSLAEAIEALLLDGRIAPGAGLPSERELAVALGISRSTTTAVYEQLAGDGLLTRRRGSGSYLRLPTGSRVNGPGGRVHRQDGVIDLSIAALPAAAGVLEAAAGRAVNRLAEFTTGVGYQPYGLSELRGLIAQRFNDRGVPTGPDQILVTNGAQHALDLILRLSLDPGEKVLTELPSYPGALDAIRAHGGRVLAMPPAADGSWDVTTMSATLLQTSPRLAMLMPDFNNPTGALIATDQRQAVLAAARRSGTRVVIDESFVELDLSRPTPAIADRPQPMAALDPDVFSLGSLSKPVWGGLRIGWIRADPETVSRLAVLRAQADMSGSLFDQLMACAVLADYDPILDRRRTELRVKRDALLAALATELPQWTPSQPVGGLSTWVRLDAPAATALTQLAEQRGILLTPGSRFAVDASLERYLRLPYALAPEVLVEAVTRIAQAWADLDQRRVRRPEASALLPA